MNESMSRRRFLVDGTVGALAAGIAASHALPATADSYREFWRGGMLYRRLGQTDLIVSGLAFGSHIDPAYKRRTEHGHALNEEGQKRRDRRISKAFDYGVNLVDTYENAGQMEPMARLVRAKRDRVLISTCRQFPMFVGENIDAAARQFGHVDLYRIYLGDGPTVDGRILEDWDVLRKAKKTGKIRAIGIATHNERTLVSVLAELEGLDFIMFPYNFIHARANYSRFLPAALKKDVGLIAIKPLAAGSIVKLDPRADAQSRPENAQTQLYHGRGRAILPAVVGKLTQSLNRLPDETLCQAALRFIYAKSFITSAMPGMFQEHELDDNYAALQRHLKLSRAEMEALDGARGLSCARGPSWLSPHYRWLDARWRA
ncbi:MAG: aldo/keto reductase [Pirellulales bacterium]